MIWKAKIDKLVYKLYDLVDDEINIIEDNATPKPSFLHRPRHSCGSRNPVTNAISHKQPAVYILASQPNGTLYTSVTSDLIKRVWEHKNHFVKGVSLQGNY